MDTNKLRPDTRRIWERLHADPLLNGFVLIGGSALTLRIGHRISEDLDFAYTGAVLPVKRLARLRDQLEGEGFVVASMPDIAAEQEFLDSGLELAEYQQNYLIDDSVKVQFVRLDNAKTRHLQGLPEQTLRVASMDELFATKAFACSERTKSRDQFDLYILMTRHGYTMADFRLVFEKAGNLGAFESACLRLQADRLPPSDEGYAHLLDDTPTRESMTQFFTAQIDALRTELARRAFQARRT